ncbi:MAG: hypothetical protein R6V28_06250 [Nitriliruptoraceae bacterium]
MPLPLVVAAGGLAVAAVSGVAASVDGVRRTRDAKERVDKAKNRVVSAASRAESAWAEADKHVRAFGDQQLRVQADTLGAWASWLEANERKVRDFEGHLVGGVAIPPFDLPELKLQVVEAERMLSGGVSAGIAGALARQAALTGVHSLASAGTGTAITGLSGAAAKSATLAWLGGGTVASGGGGVAVGTMMVNGIAVAPALLAFGLGLNVQGHRAQTKAREIEKESRVEAARLESQRLLIERLEVRVEELEQVLHELDERASEALDDLQQVEFDPAEHVELFMRVALLIEGVREILATRVVDEAGVLTPESEQVIIIHRTSTGSTTEAPT